MTNYIERYRRNDYVGPPIWGYRATQPFVPIFTDRHFRTSISRAMMP